MFDCRYVQKGIGYEQGCAGKHQPWFTQHTKDPKTGHTGEYQVRRQLVGDYDRPEQGDDTNNPGECADSSCPLIARDVQGRDDEPASVLEQSPEAFGFEERE